jgi:hypothetical protein
MLLGLPVMLGPLRDRGEARRGSDLGLDREHLFIWCFDEFL